MQHILFCYIIAGIIIKKLTEVSFIRIGEFSKKHNVTQNTVRHYLEMGLLLTKKIGGQYIFSENDNRDMKRIINLKDLGFNLGEISRLLTYLRLSGFETNEYENMLMKMLYNKRDEIRKVTQKYEKMYFDIDGAIEKIQKDSIRNISAIGFPVSYLGILRCPDCKSMLNINNGIIDNNMLIEGNIKCKCGYHLLLKDGIFIEEKTVRKRKVNGEPMPSSEEYLKTASPKFINFVCNGMIKMTDELKKYHNDSKLILELEHCVGYFLTHYIEHLPKDATYILVDYDLDKIAGLKKSLELIQEHKNFIFLCCDINRIPLKEESVDIIIDHWMTKDYAQTDNKFVLSEVMSLLKDGGILVGAYPCFKSMFNIKRIHSYALEYFNRDKLIEKIESLLIKKVQISDTDSVTEDNPYNFDVGGKEVFQMIYTGKNKT